MAKLGCFYVLLLYMELTGPCFTALFYIDDQLLSNSREKRRTSRLEYEALAPSAFRSLLDHGGKTQESMLRNAHRRVATGHGDRPPFSRLDAADVVEELTEFCRVAGFSFEIHE